MSTSFEEILLAIAVKNKLLTHDEAVAALNEFKTVSAKQDIGIYDVLVSRELLSQGQAEALAAAARKVMAAQAAPKTAAPPAAPAPNRPQTAPVPPGRPAAPPAGAPNPQEPIPGYRIVGKLGMGGTAAVFLAEDRRHGDRKVALKIIQPARAKDEKTLLAFLREAELLCAFDHPNLVKGYDKGRMGPLAYVVMEYLEGESVQDVIEREKHMPEARSLEIILEAAKAIEYMQSQGIVHRDIKPGNIMVLKDGAIKLCDLGFALEIGSIAPEEDGQTTSGTVQYMSPEQARGQSDIDIRADIYSLGASLYHMIMGELPFSGGDSLEVMAKQVMEALNSTEIKNRRISRHMHYFIERMMSKEKDLRYATPRELIDDINEQLEGFRSLEYRPDEEAQKKTNIMRGVSNQPEPPSQPQRPPLRPMTQRFKPPARPTTRRMRPPQ